MDEQESALAPEAGPVVVQPEEQGQVESQTAEDAAPAPEDEKTRTQKRRERERAARERLVSEKQAAEKAAAEAEARHKRLLDAGKSLTQPTAEDYPDPIEHAAALAVWKHEQNGAGRQAQEAEQEAKAARERAKEADQAERAALNQQWAEQVAEAKTRYADFDQVAMNNDLPISESLAVLLQTSEQGPDLLYHLGQNPALAAQLSQMHPVEAARAIGRLEATLTAPKPRTETKAPDPINPVRGAAGTRNPAEMTASEYAAWRAAGGTFKL